MSALGAMMEKTKSRKNNRSVVSFEVVVMMLVVLKNTIQEECIDFVFVKAVKLGSNSCWRYTQRRIKGYRRLKNVDVQSGSEEGRFMDMVKD